MLTAGVSQLGKVSGSVDGSSHIRRRARFGFIFWAASVTVERSWRHKFRHQRKRSRRPAQRRRVRQIPARVIFNIARTSPAHLIFSLSDCAPWKNAECVALVRASHYRAKQRKRIQPRRRNHYDRRPENIAKVFPPGERYLITAAV